jgi:7-cyano-7-deazaguanine reductase
MPTQPSKNLETFANPHSGRDYIIEIETPEFTCLCPKTGQPDFATLRLEYVPDRLCVELKSLKLYLWSYRNEGHFHEDVTNRILNDLVAATQPRWMHLTARFYVRGGIWTTVAVEHRKPGWQPGPLPPEDLPREQAELPPRESAPLAGAQETQGAALEQEAAPPAAAKPRVPPTNDAPRSGRFRMIKRARRSDATAEAPAPTPPPPPSAAARPPAVYLGIDLGTTGCRVLAINAKGEMLAHAEAPFPAANRKGDQVTQDPTRWWTALSGCLQELLTQIDPLAVRAMAVDGTSGTLLLADKTGAPLTPAILYNDQRAQEQAERIAGLAEQHCGAQGASSSLAKLLWLRDKGLTRKAAHALHQADWIGGRLTGRFGHSDYNNCLKLGYDAQQGRWPAWFSTLGVEEGLLPQVHAPGEALGTLGKETAAAFGLHPETMVLAGTTDGVASFLAAGASQPGHAVTSLGSTLILKLLSDKPVFSPEHGVYSHRLGNLWLAGGASNSGGAALLQYFKVEQMREMTPLLEPDSPTGLDYYPLPEAGERFPIYDPQMLARLEPLPGSSVTFFQGMLEGIARIEAMGYDLLAKLGAPKLAEVRTTGGGAGNPAWTRIRARTLGVKITPARSSFAAHGTALLAAQLAIRTP